jgi:hypothetical protein
MKIDRRELSRHYASLTDEELLSFNRNELTETAKVIYDQEVASRRLNANQSIGTEIEESDTDFEGTNELLDDGHEEPEWLDDGVCACEFTATPADPAIDKAALAQTVLRQAGIPSHLTVTREPSGDDATHAPEPMSVSVMVPISLALHASGILDRDLFNEQHETEWRIQLRTLSDKDLLALDPGIFCAGLLDRLARIKKAYADEMTRRELIVRPV